MEGFNLKLLASILKFEYKKVAHFLDYFLSLQLLNILENHPVTTSFSIAITYLGTFCAAAVLNAKKKY